MSTSGTKAWNNRYCAINDLRWKELASGRVGLHLKGPSLCCAADFTLYVHRVLCWALTNCIQIHKDFLQKTSYFSHQMAYKSYSSENHNHASQTTWPQEPKKCTCKTVKMKFSYKQHDKWEASPSFLMATKSKKIMRYNSLLPYPSKN